LTYSYTVRFEVVSEHARKSTKCTGCGKRLQRQRTFTQTLSPFNKYQGQLKTRERIEEELIKAALDWEQEPETCRDCLD